MASSSAPALVDVSEGHLDAGVAAFTVGDCTTASSAGQYGTSIAALRGGQGAR